MKLIGAAALAAIALISVGNAWAAALPRACTLADYLLPGEPVLKRVTAAARNKSLTITVLGTGSSILAGTERPAIRLSGTARSDPAGTAARLPDQG